MRAKKSYSQLEKQIDEQKEYIDILVHKIETLRYLELVVQNSQEAITVQDFNGKITIWNKGAQKMYGWTETQAFEMNIREIVPPEKKEEALEFIRDVAQGKKISSYETKRITADGRILDIWLTATALVNEKGMPMAVATTERDITKQKQLIKEKNKLIKELQKTNTLLQKSLEETKTLRGIIPICMICKQIRNDKGFWEQVEVYVHNHTGADFSHGICPDCLQKKFPKVYEKKMKLLSEPTARKMLD